MSKVIIKLGADISTDDIYPGRYMATVLPTETPQFCFSDRTEFNAKLKAKAFDPGSVIVADANFGCGSSREQAVSAIKGHDSPSWPRASPASSCRTASTSGCAWCSARASRPRRGTTWR